MGVPEHGPDRVDVGEIDWCIDANDEAVVDLLSVGELLDVARALLLALAKQHTIPKHLSGRGGGSVVPPPMHNEY